MAIPTESLGFSIFLHMYFEFASQYSKLDLVAASFNFIMDKKMTACATPLPPDWGKERRRRRIRMETKRSGGELPPSSKEPWGLSASESDHPHREPDGLAKLAPCYSDQLSDLQRGDGY